MAEPRLYVSRFYRADDSAPKHEAWTLADLRDRLSRHARKRCADDGYNGPAWSPAHYESGTRAAKNVALVTCFVVDFDAGQRPDEWFPRWEGLWFVAHTTFRHTDEKPRWRAVFPLASAVEGKDWASVWGRLTASLTDGQNDRKCKDASRLYFLPACHPDREGEAWSFSQEGGLLDPGSFADPASLLEPAVPDFTPPAKGKGKTIPDGERDDTLYRIACGMRKRGEDHPAILAELRDVNAKWCVPPKTEDDVQRIARSAMRHAPEPGAAESRAAEDRGGDRPTILVSNRQLLEVTEDALVALETHNEPKRLFSQGPQLVRVERESEGKHYLRAVRMLEMRNELGQAANWTSKDEKDRVKPTFVPKDLAENLLASQSLSEWFPGLLGLASAPFMDRGGRIVREAGYDEGSRWFLTHPGPWPEHPGDGVHAAAWVLDELFGDFRFADEASRANALALFVLPFVRAGIDGPTPMHFVDAPAQGAGKGLLVDVALRAGLGYAPATTPLPPDESQMSKLLFSLLSQGEQVIFFDNVKTQIKSASLENCLTTRVYKDRTLGVTNAPEVRVQSIFALTANNGKMSKDGTRRSVWIRLDPKLENPEERTDFRHTPLGPWVDANRPRLVAAALAMLAHWAAAGRPPGSRRKGSYEAWAATVGGVLESCGVKGLLGNDAKLRTSANDDDEQWRAFYELWWTRHRDARISTKDLRLLAEERELLEDVMAKAKSEKGRSMAFGQALSNRDGKVLDGRAPEKQPFFKGEQQYRLRLTGAVDVEDGEARQVPDQDDLFDVEDEVRL